MALLSNIKSEQLARGSHCYYSRIICSWDQKFHLQGTLINQNFQQGILIKPNFQQHLDLMVADGFTGLLAVTTPCQASFHHWASIVA